MASVCSFVKSFFIGAPLKYYLNYHNVRQRCIVKVNPGKGAVFRNPHLNSRNVLKDVITYKRLSLCRINSSHPAPLLSSFPCIFINNHAHSPQRQSPFSSNPTRSYSTSKRTSNFPTMIGLSDLPAIVGPTLFNSLRNWLLSTLVIRMHLDKDFELPEFVKAASRAVELVTTRLSNSDYGNLEGLISDSLLTKIKSKLSSCSLAQRQELAMDLKDVVFQYPYQIGIIFDEDNDKGEETPRRFVEITMCYHILKGYAEAVAKMQEAVSNNPFNATLTFPEQDQVYIVNCRFVREYTEGVDDQWTINAFNYFLLHDYEQS